MRRVPKAVTVAAIVVTVLAFSVMPSGFERSPDFPDPFTPGHWPVPGTRSTERQAARAARGKGLDGNRQVRLRHGEVRQDRRNSRGARRRARTRGTRNI
jgi:hypothetical protein